jgi:hypothetical protein
VLRRGFRARLPQRICKSICAGGAFLQPAAQGLTGFSPCKPNRLCVGLAPVSSPLFIVWGSPGISYMALRILRRATDVLHRYTVKED